MFNKFPAKTDILGALWTLDLQIFLLPQWKIVECIKKNLVPICLNFLYLILANLYGI